jgi:predicted dehydrogenase
MEKLSIGIIGAGYIGREHARSLRLVRPMFGDRLVIAAIADKNLEAAASAAKDFEIERFTDDVNSVIDDPSINVIFSCLPTKFHIDVIERAAKLGKPIFFEKPFAVSLEQAQKVNEILTTTGVPNQVGFVLRYAPTYHALKKLLDLRAKESPLRTIVLRDDQMFPIKGISHFTDWRSKVDLAGAGVLIEHGIHDLDLFEWLFGKVKRVSARSNNFAGYEGIEDYMEVRLEFASGVTGNMVHIWHDIPAHQSIRHFEIFFHKALITLDTYDMHHITVRDEKAEAKLERPDLYQMIVNEPLFKDLSNREDMLFVSDYYAIQDYWFVRNLLEGNELSPTIKDGLRAFTVGSACYESAGRDGEWVNV